MALELAARGYSQLWWTNIVCFAKTTLQKLLCATLMDTWCIFRGCDVFCCFFSFLSTMLPSSLAWDNSLGKMTLFSSYSSKIFF